MVEGVYLFLFPKCWSFFLFKYQDRFIPIFNEEDNVKQLGESIVNVLNDSNFEILFINDGSKDKTNIFLNEYKKKYD